jgi:hypothetical protein
MKVLVYDAHSYDQMFLNEANQGRHELVYTAAVLDQQTAALAEGCASHPTRPTRLPSMLSRCC